MTPSSGDGDDSNYRVGYRKPPKHTQFQAGRSGNPKGRPKGTKNFKTDLAEELAERIVVREGDQSRHVSKQRAVVKSLVARTLKGDARAAPLLLSLISELNGERTELAASPELDEARPISADRIGKILDSLAKLGLIPPAPGVDSGWSRPGSRRATEDEDDDLSNGLPTPQMAPGPPDGWGSGRR